MLDQCYELLAASEVVGTPAVAATLQADQRKPPLPLPAGHKGDRRTRMFQISITIEQCSLLLEVLEAAKAHNAYTRDTQNRGLGGFAECCQELLRWRTDT